MKALVLSDIHANQPALEAVLADAKAFDTVWILGDLTGYGAAPNECITRVRSLPQVLCLTGNHDTAVLNLIGIEDFNDEARQAVTWTAGVISKSNIEYLSSRLDREVADSCTLVHASPRHPVWEYILDTYTAKINFNYFNTDLCLIGHTHIPSIFRLLGNHHIKLEIPSPGKPIQLKGRVILNPGSVGQPRDHNPSASYMILDTENHTCEYYRVAYDIRAAQERILEAGLPPNHAYRLAMGY
ncbi:MAG: metallophosphoesterase family protein [Chloroflexota bacterium]